MRKAVSPVIIAITLTAIVIAVASIYYAQIASLSQFSASTLEIVDAKLVKHYGYVRLVLKVYNGNDYPVDIVTKLYTEFKEVISKIETIPPKTTKTIIIEGKYGCKFLVGKKYVVEIVELKNGGSNAVGVECTGIQLFNGKVLILAPTTMLHIEPRHVHGKDKAGSMENVSKVVDGILEIVEDLGILTKVINNLEDWKYIVEHPTEYRNVMIINPFGGIVPIPTEYIGNPYEFIEKIGENVREYGWIWSHITGYPFYYASDGNAMVMLHKFGIKHFLGIEKNWCIITCGGGKQYYVYPSTAEIPDLRTWLSNLGYSEIANKLTDFMHIRFSLITHHVPQEWINRLFYTRCDKLSGSFVLNLGKGLYVHWGSPYFLQFSDEELGKLALLTALYAELYR